MQRRASAEIRRAPVVDARADSSRPPRRSSPCARTPSRRAACASLPTPRPHCAAARPAPRVVGGSTIDRDAIVILGRGAHHRRTADVDVLDRVLVRAVRLSRRSRERIEIDDQQVDRLDAVRRHDRVVDAAAAEQAAVHLRMQRLDAAVHDLGKAGVAGDLGDRHAAALEQRGGAAGARAALCRDGAARARIRRGRLCRKRRAARAGRVMLRLGSVRQAVLSQFLAQRAAIDAENVGRAALVAFGVVQHGLEQRLFHFAQHQVVQLRRACGRSGCEIGLERFARSWSAAAARAAQAVATGSRRALVFFLGAMVSPPTSYPRDSVRLKSGCVFEPRLLRVLEQRRSTHCARCELRLRVRQPASRLT